MPNTPDTHDLYDAKLFASFKPTALFINVGRGVAVVDADLVEALRVGHLAGAIIDVCRQSLCRSVIRSGPPTVCC
ncbi:hypothetical protein ALP29_200491 [Pseudomonas syringae pv. avii]|uniref:D-isomer specific 2-hydroxyacid dehydrogenase NAD-binding domain-containing protein n=1 Tax=Pseudomonas syringae pv. avii TaxID=663959 RepID=A0A3M5U6G3_PSESX|nr:hypothetical protein ALP29_200491 [Pseudomonas syringae pv. avii]